jgi:hypothetical protein
MEIRTYLQIEASVTMKNVDHCQRIVTEGPDLVGADRLGNALI